jgi:hypothetical protein
VELLVSNPRMVGMAGGGAGQVGTALGVGVMTVGGKDIGTCQPITVRRADRFRVGEWASHVRSRRAGKLTLPRHLTQSET